MKFGLWGGRAHEPVALDSTIPTLNQNFLPSRLKQSHQKASRSTGCAEPSLSSQQLGQAGQDAHLPQSAPSQRAALTVQPWITTKVLLLWLKWQVATDSVTPGMRWQVSSAMSSGVLRANLLSISTKSLPSVISEKATLGSRLSGGLLGSFAGMICFRFTSNHHPCFFCF